MTGHSKALGMIGLLTASFFWGAEFVVEKDILSIMGANYSNFIRFFIASVVCTLVMMPRMKRIKKSDIRSGCITGCFMGLGFAFQTMGLSHINAGENALLCSAYILMIPLTEWILFKRYPGYRIIIYAIIALVGIVFISYDVTAQAWNFSSGEILTLAGAVFYTGAIISIDRLSVSMDSSVLSLIQFYIITIISGLFALLLEEAPEAITGTVVLEFLYLIVFATIGAQFLMNRCIKYVSSSAAGLIFSSEALFAAVLGILILNDPSTLTLWTGVILIVGSIALYQIGFPNKITLFFNSDHD